MRTRQTNRDGCSTDMKFRMKRSNKENIGVTRDVSKCHSDHRTQFSEKNSNSNGSCDLDSKGTRSSQCASSNTGLQSCGMKRNTVGRVLQPLTCLSIQNINNCNKSAYENRSPVWADMSEAPRLVTKERRKSVRLSCLNNSKVYEFEFSPEEPPKKIRKLRVKKHAKGTAKHKPCRKLKLMTTDVKLHNDSYLPMLHAPPGGRLTGAVSRESDLRVPAVCESNDYECTSDNDTGYDASISVQTEPGSLLVCPSDSSVAAYRTESDFRSPVFSKVLGKFAGPTSTPTAGREDLFAYSVPTKRSVKEDVNLCFGFDESDEQDTHFSPVHKSVQLCTLSLLCSDGEDHQPSRFTVDNNRIVRNFGCKHHLKTVCSAKSVTKSTSSCRVGNIHANSTENMDCSQLFKESKVNLAEEAEVLEEVQMKEEKRVTHMMPSPVKLSFKVPRRSYERSYLEEKQRKFMLECAGGEPSSDESDEEEGNLASRVKLRRRHLAKPCNMCVPKPSAVKSLKRTRPHPPVLSSSSDGTSDSPNSSTASSRSQKRVEKKSKKEQVQEEQLISDMNTHFSEVEEIQLVIE